MYSPTTRLLTVLELLQSYKELSGAELAERLEVDRRTVRRYIMMLQDMGIPIEAERGRNGAYQLRRGYKLPPLMFTEPEAIALTLGLLAIREFHFPVDVAAVEGALAKTERVMPEKLLQQARALQEAIVFNLSFPQHSLHNEIVGRLSSAVQQSQQVRLLYHTKEGNESERTFEPYGIVFNEGYWYTAGYCHLRQDVRTFRLDRIVSVELGKSIFQRPANFNLLDYVLTSITATPGPYQVEVLLETSMEAARKVISPSMGILEPSVEGVIFRRSTDYLEWIAEFLLGLDFPLRVTQPVELKAIFHQRAAKILHMIGEEI